MGNDIVLEPFPERNWVIGAEIVPGVLIHAGLFI